MSSLPTVTLPKYVAINVSESAWLFRARSDQHFADAADGIADA
jgi:hypothetical protein